MDIEEIKTMLVGHRVGVGPSTERMALLWIIERLQETEERMTRNMEAFKFPDLEWENSGSMSTGNLTIRPVGQAVAPCLCQYEAGCPRVKGVI